MSPRFSREHRRFLIVEEVIGATIINFLLNGGIAWFVFRAAASVPLWGRSSIAADTLTTAFLLPLFTALVASFFVGWQVEHGKLPPLAPDEIRSTRWLRRPSYQRGLLLGVYSMILLAAPVVGLFALVGPTELPLRAFIIFKASFAAGVGVLVTPLLGWWALVDASRRAAARV